MNGTVNNPIGCFNLVIETFFKSSLTLRQSSVTIFPLISIVLMLISVEVDVEHGKESVSCLYIAIEESSRKFWLNIKLPNAKICLIQFRYNLCKNNELSFYFFSHPVSVFGLLSDFVISFA